MVSETTKIENKIPKVLKIVKIKKHNDGPIRSRIVGYTAVTANASDQFKVPAIEPANPFTSDEKISPENSLKLEI